jgi:ribosomal protein S2
MKKHYKSLINIQDIIDYKGYVGDTFLHKDIKTFVSGITGNKGSYIFDFVKQLRALKRVSFLLKFLVLRKPILFFGLNKKNFDSAYRPQISRINKKIFDLTINIRKEDEEVHYLIDNFYSKFYEEIFSENEKIDELIITKNFSNYDKFLSDLELKGSISINGFFFDNWEDSYLTNYHTLKSHLNYRLKELFFEKNNGSSVGQDKEKLISFLEKFRNFFYLSKILDYNNNTPGVAIFFSKEGYEGLFLELKKLGVPVVCILNTSESLEGVDFPLFGNTLYFDVILFYQKIINKILNK